MGSPPTHKPQPGKAFPGLQAIRPVFSLPLSSSPFRPPCKQLQDTGSSETRCSSYNFFFSTLNPRDPAHTKLRVYMQTIPNAITERFLLIFNILRRVF